MAERQYRKYRRYQGFKFKRTKTKMLPLLSDVVNGVVLGEPDAESMLYEVVSRAAKLHLCRCGMSSADASDHAHEVYMIVLEAVRAGELRCADALVGFIRTIARRRMAAYIASVARQRAACNIDDISVRDLSRDPERIAMDDELMGLARRVLDAMRPLERELLRRCYLQEESEAQIRAALGLTETQFRLSKSRAKTRFGKLVRESVKGKKRQKKAARS